MKFRFVWIGRTKNENWQALQAEYLQRLSHFVKVETIEIKDGTTSDAREIESKRILEKVNQSNFVCVLDVKGRSVSSHGLAGKIENWQNRSVKEIVFVMGGAEGVTSEVVE